MRVKASARVATGEEYPERLYQFILFHADGLHERHRRDHLHAGGGGYRAGDESDDPADPLFIAGGRR